MSEALVIVIHIGSKSAFVALFSDEDLLCMKKIDTGGTFFNKSLIEYVNRHYKMKIDEETAERVKKKIGCVTPMPKQIFMNVKTEKIHTGCEQKISLGSDELVIAYMNEMNKICEAFLKCLLFVPDRQEVNIFLSGSCSKVYGVEKFLRKRFNLPPLCNSSGFVNLPLDKSFNR